MLQRIGKYEVLETLAGGGQGTVYLAKDEETEEYLIVTHWESEEANLAWIRSDSFKQAHAGPHPDYIMGGEFKTYNIRLSRAPQAATG